MAVGPVNLRHYLLEAFFPTWRPKIVFISANWFEKILKKYAIAQNTKMQKKSGQAFWYLKFINNLFGNVKLRSYKLRVTKNERQIATSNHVHSHFIIINNNSRFFSVLNLAVYIVHDLFCKFNALSSLAIRPSKACCLNEFRIVLDLAYLQRK